MTKKGDIYHLPIILYFKCTWGILVQCDRILVMEFQESILSTRVVWKNILGSWIFVYRKYQFFTLVIVILHLYTLAIPKWGFYGLYLLIIIAGCLFRSLCAKHCTNHFTYIISSCNLHNNHINYILLSQD